jgi:hypothetical protein
LILLSLAVFFLPLSCYLIFLGTLNRRRHPVLVRGAWDFAGVLFAASGFLLFAGPSAFLTLHERLLMLRAFRPGDGAAGLGWPGWVAVWALLALVYFGGIFLGAVLLLRRRARLTAVYNVEPGVFDEVLAHVLDRLASAWVRSGDRVVLHAAARPSDGVSAVRGEHPALAAGNRVGPPPAPVTVPTFPDGDGLRAVLLVRPSPALWHVELCWEQADEDLRREIEAELAQVLGEVYTRENVLGGWLLTAGILLSGLTGVLFLVAALQAIFSRL